MKNQTYGQKTKSAKHTVALKWSKKFIAFMLVIAMMMSTLSVAFAQTSQTEIKPDTVQEDIVEGTEDAEPSEASLDPAEASPEVSDEAPSESPSEPAQNAVAKSAEAPIIRPLAADYTASIKWTDFGWLTGTTINDTTHDLLGKQQDQTVKYSLEFSNSISYEIGEVEIRVPYAIYTYRDDFINGANSSERLTGKGVIFSDIGIAKGTTPNDSSAFCYELDEANNEIVITNRKAISAASTNLMQISYALNSYMTKDGTSWEIKPKLTVKGVAQPEGSLGAITGSMDTGVELTNLTKTTLSNFTEGRVYSWYKLREVINCNTTTNVQLKTFDELYGQEQPADFDDYNWVAYRVNFTVDATQPYTLEFDEMPGSSGEVYFYALRSDTLGNSPLLSEALEEPFNVDASKALNIYFQQPRTIGYVVVRYPKATTPENTTIHNEIKVTAKGIDGKDAASSKTADVTSVWQDYYWTYPKDTISITKMASSAQAGYPEPGERMLTLYKANSLQGQDTQLSHGSYMFYMTSRFRGYNNTKDGGTYDLQVLDDYIYAKTPSTSYVRLTPNDYYISDLYIGAMQEQVDSAGGTMKVYGNNLTGTVKVYAMTKANPNTWVDAGTIPKTALSDRSGSAWSMWSHINASVKEQGIYRVKVAIEGIDAYNCELTIAPVFSIRASSPIFQSYLNAKVEEVTLSNNAGVIGLDKDGVQFAQPVLGDYSDDLPEDIASLDQSVYGHYVQRDNAETTITGLTWDTEATKSVVLTNDASKNRVTQDWTLRGVEYMNFRGGDTTDLIAEIEALREGGIPVDRNEAVIYDLLPPGCFFDPDVEPTVWLPNISDRQESPGVLDSYQVIDNYKGTGRQLIIFRVSTPAGEDNANYVSRGYMITRCETGYTVNFRSYYKWADYNTANNTENYMAYQTSDELWGGNGFADEGLGTNAPTTSDVPTSNSAQAFYNLAGKGSVNTGLKNTIYAKVLQATGISVSTETGAHKLVKADADILANFETSAMVETNGSYTYQITVQNKESSKMKDVVLFDRLERAAIDRAAAEPGAFDADYWQGVLVDINVFAAQTKGIAPKIYYSTNPNAAYDLTDGASGWTDVKPGNLSTVKAIAIDLSKKSDGTDFEFESLEGTNIKITMKAPATMPATAVHAYNNPAYYSTSIPTVGAPQSSVAEGDSVKVKIYEKAELTVQKTVTGTGAPAGEVFEFVVTMDDDPYARKEYTLYQGITEIGKGYTNSEGKLTLAHGQKAVFADAVAGEVFKVVETAKTGYTTTPGSREITGKLVKVGEGINIAAFTNKYTANDTSLTVQKTVTAEAGFTAPSTDEFEFILKIEDTIAVGQSYRLYTGSTEESGTFVTDAAGKFKLKGGQKAVFEGLEVGDDYEVSEVAKTNYEISSPTSGKIEGTLTSTGATAAFTNNYEPKSTLTVKKVVTGTGAPATDTFEFTVKVANVVYASKEYTHYAADGITTSTKTTSAAGKLSLKAGEKAVFDGIFLNSTYEVTEAAAADYNTTSDGATGSIAAGGKTATFTNAYNPGRDLTITKTVVGTGAPSADTFEFTILINSNAYAGKAYKLYTGSTEESGTFTTDGSGKFTLRGGQKAVFADVPLNANYVVTEAAKADYTTTKTGDTGTIGTTGNLAAFTNTYAPKRNLEITKTVTASSGFTAPAGDTFTFTVTVNGALYASKTYKVYEGATLIDTRTTTATGQLTLTHGQKAVFEGLAVDSTYKVVESAKTGYDIASPANGEAAGTIEVGGNATVAFTNNYEPKSTLTVKKVVTGTGAPATDTFEFTVTVNSTAYASKDYTHYAADGITTSTKTTSAAGKLSLKAGEKAVFEGIVTTKTYVVTETAKTDYTTTKTGDSGTIGANGSTAVFTNAYTPSRDLKITKKVTASGGLTAPNGDTFTFTVTVNSTLYASKSYKVYDITNESSPSEISGTYATNASGELTLQANQMAVFANVPVGATYSIVESPKAGYVQTTPANNAAATGSVQAAGSTAAFVNNYEPKQGLTIQKTVTGTNAPATDTFEFTVKVAGVVYGGKTYTHYAADGITTSKKTTSADGKLTLKAGEKALFEGIVLGTAYEVTETQQEHYEQTTPANKGAATGTILASGSLASFVNLYDPKAPNIGVVKTSNKMFDDTDDTEAISNVVKAGDEITYTLTVTNSGNKDATNVTVRDYIPEGTTYKAGTAGGGTVHTASDGRTYLQWNIAAVAKQTSTTVSFTVTVDALGENETAKSIVNVGYFDNGNENPTDPEDPTDPEKPTNELKNPVIEIVKVASPAGNVKEGDIITYTIKVKVTEGGAKDVEIEDTLPQGLSLVKDSISYRIGGGASTNVGCKYENGIVSWPKTDLPIGESTFTFKAVVDVLASGEKSLEIKNVAVVKVPDKETDPYESTESVVTVQSRAANITKTAALVVNGTASTEARGTDAAPIEAIRSQTVEYHITVTGVGAKGLKSGNIEVIDPIPAGTIFVEDSITAVLQDTVPSSTAKVISKELTADGVKWVINGLDDGEKAYLTFQVKAPRTTDDPATADIYETSKAFSNTADMLDVAMEESVYTTTVTVVDKEGNTTTHTANDTIYKESAYEKESETTYHITKSPLVVLTKTSDPVSSAANGLIPCVKEGDEITYTLTVVNNGATAADKVHVCDVIPEHTTYVKNSLTGNGVYSESENRIDWEIDNLAVGEANKVVLTFKVTVNEINDDNCGIIRNVAHSYVPHPEEEPAKDPLPPLEEYTPSNPQEHQTNTFAKIADPVGGVDTQNATKVAEGQVITYTMQFNATGEVEAVVVKDTIPEGLTLVSGSIEIIDTTGAVKPVADSVYESSSRVITWPTQAKVDAGITGFRFKATVDKLATLGDKLYENKAVLTYDPGDGSEVDEESNTVVHKAQKGEASISKTAALIVDNAPVNEDRGHSTAPVATKRGQTVEYRLTVTYSGATSGELVITDALPEGTTLVAGSIGAEITDAVPGSTAKVVSMDTGQVTTPGGSTKNGIEWVLNSLSEGEKAILTFRVYAPISADNKDTVEQEYEKVFTNVAMVVDKEKEMLVYEEDTALHTKGESVFTDEEITKLSEITHHIVKDPGLSATKLTDRTNGETVKAGEKITYTIQLENNGKEMAENVIIRDMIPEFTTYVAGSATCSIAGVEAKATIIDGRDGLMWTVPEIAVGSTVEVKFSVTVDKMDYEGTRIIKNVAQFTELDPGEDPNNPGDKEYDESNPVENKQTGTPSKNTDNAKTGDANKLLEIVILLAIAMALLIGLVLFKATKQKKMNK